MRSPVLAIALVLGLLAGACGGASDAARSHQADDDDTPALRHRPSILGAGADQALPPSPQNMPGGGRGWDTPHTRGKP